MITTRVMPCLLLKGEGLVKTIKFKDPKYVGDPRNVVKIFNEKEVDELVILDIDATARKLRPRFGLIEEIVSEAFMPVAYGGGIHALDDARTILQLGVEKIVLSSHAVENPSFVRVAADVFGSQSVVVCIDVKRGHAGQYEAYTHNGTIPGRVDAVQFAREMAGMGAGEIMVNSIDRDGTMIGYDLPLIQAIAGSVTTPVIACGGAGKLEDFRLAVTNGGASAVAAGSLFVFHGKHRAVLVKYPKQADLEQLFPYH
jgi:cyclase